MKKIQNILFLSAFAFTLTLVSCSNDEDIVATPTPTTPDPLEELGAVTGTMAYAEDVEAGPGDSDRIRSKSTLYFDREQSKMQFTWKENDVIGIFPETNERMQIPFRLDSSTPLSVQENSVTGVFEPADGGVSPITGGDRYFSYTPYISYAEAGSDFSFNEIPVSFEGQVQAANDQMNCYWQGLYGIGLTAEKKREYLDKFLESEKAASAHLGAKDYMISDATATTGNHVHFNYSRMVTIVRFYLLCPEPASAGLYIDSLQVVNNDREFTTEGVLLLPSKTLSARKTSHRISLKFEPAIDMTNNSDDSKETYNYWDKDYPTDGYIMAYMIIAPINLDRPEIRNSTLYMCAHTETGSPVVKTKKYYKATLSKMNFEVDKHYQWAPDLNPDEPITFKEVKIQEWEEGTGYNNNGNGTSDW